MHWRGALDGSTPRGKTFARTNDKVVTWVLGERCFGVSGTSEGTVRNRVLRTVISSYRRCQGGCPEAGGQIRVTDGADKIKAEILYDGSNVATYTTPRGTTSVTLACQN
jgi:hypothetical protein